MSAQEALVLAASALALLVFSVPARLRVLDDAYITFRFAEHLRAGEGLVWNIGGAHTEGFSSLLHVLMCAAGLVAGFDPLTVTRIVSLASLAACALVARTWIAQLRVEPSWLEIGTWPLILANGLLLYASLFGLETTLFTGLLTASAYAYWRWTATRSRAAAIAFVAAATLSVACRPEAPLWLAVLLGVDIVAAEDSRSRSASATLAAIVFAASAVFLLAKYAYFGRMPNPFYVKRARGLVSGDGIRYVLQFCAWRLPILAGAIRAMASARYRKTLGPIGLASIAYILVFVRFDPLMGTAFRFLLPTWPILAVLGLAGLGEFIRDWRRRWPAPRAVRGAAAMAGALWVLVWAASAWTHIVRTLEDLTPRQYEAIGTALNAAQISPRPWLAIGDQGALPYFSRWSSLDFVGLTTNEIATLDDSDAIATLVLGRRPEVIVIRHNARSGRPFITHDRTRDLGGAVANHPAFRGTYRAVGDIPDEDGERITFYLDAGAPRAAAIDAALQQGLAAARAVQSLPGGRQLAPPQKTSAAQTPTSAAVRGSVLATDGTIPP